MIGLCPVCYVYVETTSSLLVFFPGAFLGGRARACVRDAFESRSVGEGEEGATVFIFSDFDVVDGEGLVGVVVHCHGGDEFLVVSV
jgi:hypothetical protein